MKSSIATSVVLCIFALQPSRADDVNNWIGQLNSDSYEERQSATRRLTKAGEVVLPALMEASKKGNDETKWRAYRAIKAIIGEDKKMRAEIKRRSEVAGIDWLAKRLAPPLPILNKTVARAYPIGSRGSWSFSIDSVEMTIAEKKKMIIELESIIKDK